MGASGLGNLLVKEGFLTEQDRQTIVRTCGQGSWAFAKTILTMGLLDEDELAAFFAERTRFVVAPRDLLDRIDPNITKKIDKRLFSKLEILPIEMDHYRITVAVADPLDKATLKQLEFFTGLEVVPIIAPISQIYEGLLRLNPDFRPSLTALTNFLRNHSGSAWVKQKLIENPALNASLVAPSDSRQGARISEPKPAEPEDFELEDLPEPSHAHHSHNLDDLDSPGFEQGFRDSDFSDIPMDANDDVDLLGEISDQSTSPTSGGVGFGFDFDEPAAKSAPSGDVGLWGDEPDASASSSSSEVGLWGDESDSPQAKQSSSEEETGLWGDEPEVASTPSEETSSYSASDTSESQEDALDIFDSFDAKDDSQDEPVIDLPSAPDELTASAEQTNNPDLSEIEGLELSENEDSEAKPDLEQSDMDLFEADSELSTSEEHDLSEPSLDRGETESSNLILSDEFDLETKDSDSNPSLESPIELEGDSSIDALALDSEEEDLSPRSKEPETDSLMASSLEEATELDQFDDLLKTDGVLTEDIMETTQVLDSIMPEGDLPIEIEDPASPTAEVELDSASHSSQDRIEVDNLLDFSDSLEAKASLLHEPKASYPSDPLPIEALGITEDEETEVQSPLRDLIHKESNLSVSEANDSEPTIDEDQPIDLENDISIKSNEHDESILNLVASHGLSVSLEDPLDISPQFDEASFSKDALSVDLDPHNDQIADDNLSSTADTVTNTSSSQTFTEASGENILAILSYDSAEPAMTDSRTPIVPAAMESKDLEDDLFIKRSTLISPDDDHLKLSNNKVANQNIPPPPPVLQAIDQAHQLIAQLSLCFNSEVAQNLASDHLPLISKEGCVISLKKDSRILYAWAESGGKKEVSLAFQKFIKTVTNQLPDNGWTRLQIPRSAQWLGKASDVSALIGGRDGDNPFLLMIPSQSDHASLREVWEQLMPQLTQKL